MNLKIIIQEFKLEKWYKNNKNIFYKLETQKLIIIIELDHKLV